MAAVRAAACDLGGVKAACQALGASRATHYRRSRPKQGPRRRPSSPRALSETERAQVLETLNSERFADQAPAEVHAELLDEGRYQCSVARVSRTAPLSDERPAVDREGAAGDPGAVVAG
jgi:putative transposase